MSLGHTCLTILNVAQGHYEEALTHGREIMRRDPSLWGSQCLPEIVECSVRVGNDETAAVAMERLRGRASASGTPWALGLLARSEALVALHNVEPLYQEAIRQLGTTLVKTDLARAHLLYGEWLRRQRRISEAQQQLAVALTLFDDMGAMAFAQRTRIELAATGRSAPTPSRRRAVGFELTPQERQIALLAADRLTNAEIASQLFLSVSTIDYHLRKVFQKLSINSRRQLSDQLLAGTNASG